MPKSTFCDCLFWPKWGRYDGMKTNSESYPTERQLVARRMNGKKGGRPRRCIYDKGVPGVTLRGEPVVMSDGLNLPREWVGVKTRVLRGNRTDQALIVSGPPWVVKLI